VDELYDECLRITAIHKHSNSFICCTFFSSSHSTYYCNNLTVLLKFMTRSVRIRIQCMSDISLGMGVSQAARLYGISERTVYRYVTYLMILRVVLILLLDG
jgi:hypothetical protein